MRVGNMLADQSAFCRRLAELGRLPVGAEAQTKEFCLQLVAEAVELLDEVNWKHHRKADKAVDRGSLLAEAVDVQKFLINVLVAHGVTEDEFHAAWVAKTQLVQERLAAETDPWQVAAEKERARALGLEDDVRKLQEELARRGRELEGASVDHERLAARLAAVQLERDEERDRAEEAERNLRNVQTELDGAR